jgi:diadenosine tetraphosphatase ApaH/serine/threonine PP2A family protein phosphatase
MTDRIALAPGPVLVFGGPYSNLAATVAMRAVAAERGIPPQNCICTGDVVAYCAHPEETVAFVRDWGIPVVAGNCEESLGTAADDCGCGFDEGSACSTLSVQWYRYADRSISPESRRWMRALPGRLDFRLGGRAFCVVHGSVSQVNRFVFASTPTADKLAELALTDADVVIGGHSGIPFGQRLDERRAWLNAGVIGLPANDGTPDGWYLLLTAAGDDVTASLHRLHYDAGSAAAAMRAQGLDNAYAATLLDGLWPSEDVLPEEERRARGRPLVPGPIRF